MPDKDAPLQLDDETRAALLLFNQRLAAEEEAERDQRKVRRAEQAKDEAAARLRRLKEEKAPAEKVAEAEAEYRQLLARFTTIRDGGDPDADADADADAAEHEPEPEAEAEAADTENETDTDTADETAAAGS